MNNQSETIGALAGALAKAQGSLNAALKDSKNPHLKNKYADLAAVWKAAREPLSDNELAVIQTTERGEGGQYLVTTLAHSSGEWIRGELAISSEGGNKGVNPDQALGSSISYMRRYALAAIVGVIQDDDDGNASSGNNGHRSNPEPQPEIDPRPLENAIARTLIKRIEKAEESLGEHGNARNNSRKKHLDTKNLYDPSIPLEKLQEFFQHVANKFRDKRKAEEAAADQEAIEEVAAETSEAMQTVIDGIDGEQVAEPQSDVMGRN